MTATTFTTTSTNVQVQESPSVRSSGIFFRYHGACIIATAIMLLLLLLLLLPLLLLLRLLLLSPCFNRDYYSYVQCDIVMQPLSHLPLQPAWRSPNRSLQLLLPLLIPLLLPTSTATVPHTSATPITCVRASWQDIRDLCYDLCYYLHCYFYY